MLLVRHGPNCDRSIRRVLYRVVDQIADRLLGPQRIVIGGGIAGSSIALRLAEKGRRVML